MRWPKQRLGTESSRFSPASGATVDHGPDGQVGRHFSLEVENREVQAVAGSPPPDLSSRIPWKTVTAGPRSATPNATRVRAGSVDSVLFRRSADRMFAGAVNFRIASFDRLGAWTAGSIAEPHRRGPLSARRRRCRCPWRYSIGRSNSYSCPDCYRRFPRGRRP